MMAVKFKLNKGEILKGCLCDISSCSQRKKPVALRKIEPKVFTLVIITANKYRKRISV